MPVNKSVKKVPSRRVTRGRTPKTVSFGVAVCNFFKKYFQFSGVATRAEYWWVMLFLFIVFFGLSFVFGVFSLVLESLDMYYASVFFILAMSIAGGLSVIAMCVFFIPMFALTARRLHDAGFSAKVLWLYLVLFVSVIFAHWFGFYESLLFLLLYWSVQVGFGMFVFVASLLPSKMHNNPYRD